MGGIRFCGCGWAPVRGFLCLLWRETHTKSLSARFLTRLEEDEKKARSPSSEQRGVSDIQGDGQRKVAADRLGAVDLEARSASARGWVGAPGSCVGIFVRVHARDSTEAQNDNKLPKLLPSYALG